MEFSYTNELLLTERKITDGREKYVALLSYQRLSYMNQLVPRQVQVYISLYDRRIVDHDLSYIHGKNEHSSSLIFEDFMYIRILVSNNLHFHPGITESLLTKCSKSIMSMFKDFLHRISELKSTYEIVNRHRLRQGKAQMQ